MCVCKRVVVGIALWCGEELEPVKVGVRCYGGSGGGYSLNGWERNGIRCVGYGIKGGRNNEGRGGGRTNWQ